MSSYKIITLYAVHQGDDDRHAGRPEWYFESSGTANSVAEGRGWYGGKAPVSVVKAILIDGLAFRIESDEPIKVNETPDDQHAKKQAALDKLTYEEKKMLGLLR